MALFTSWIDAISSNPLLLCNAVYKGNCRLEYNSAKPEQLNAVESLLKGKGGLVSFPT